jgi:antitoxin ParD1/3/4
MGIVRKTDKQDACSKAQIDAGHYTSHSEHIFDRIRREQERCGEIEGIRAALVEGEASGEPGPFDTSGFKRRMLTLPLNDDPPPPNRQ